MKLLFCILSFSFSLFAVPAPVRILPARTVVVGERAVTDVHVAEAQVTLIVLPERELSRAIFIGDGSDWDVKPSEQPSRYLAVKIKAINAVNTTLSIISDHNKSYTFHLINDTAECDSKVFIDPDSQLAQEISAPSQWVPRAEADAKTAASEKAAADAKEQATAAIAKTARENEAFRATYPQKLHFDYQFDRRKAEQFGVTEIWDDGTMTYIKADPQEAPAFYEIKDKKPSLTAWDFHDGTYTVPKLVNEGYLKIGKVQITFKRERN